MEELIDVLDEFGNKTGIVKTKSEVKRDGDYHRAISVLIISNDNILIQKRSKNKKVYPSLWSIFVKGHVQSNESAINACIRELNEELGISISKDELEFLYTLKEEKINGDYIENIFYDTYILKKIINLEDIVIQQEELDDIGFINISELHELINNNDFVPNDEDYKRVLKYIKTAY